MKKFDLPFWSDTLFAFFGGWLLFLCILRLYHVSLLPAVFLALLIGLLCGTGTFFLLYARKKKKGLLARDRQEKEDLMLRLLLCSDEERERLLVPWAKADGVFLFRMQPLSADEIALELSRRGGAPFTLYCRLLSPEAANLCEDFSVEVVTEDEIYQNVRENGLLPEEAILPKRRKKTARDRLKITFSRKNARAFALSGGVLLAMSLFTFFPLYYVIGGSILLFSSLVVRLFGQR